MLTEKLTYEDIVTKTVEALFGAGLNRRTIQDSYCKYYGMLGKYLDARGIRHYDSSSIGDFLQLNEERYRKKEIKKHHYDETQSAYHSAVNTYAGTIGVIPHTSEDPERTGVILSALACESHYTVIEQLYETVLGEKLIRDESSRHMLDYAFAGTVYDPGLIWNFGEIQGTLLNNKKTDIASMLASVEKKVTKAIDTFNTFLDEVE
ncbi:MAG: hypothetical protein II979_05210 [Clostridia bacterium]|nr:hypothetical protein [Clostridia bacterium]